MKKTIPDSVGLYTTCLNRLSLVLQAYICTFENLPGKRFAGLDCARQFML